MLSLIPRFSPWHVERPTQGQYEIQNAVKGVSGIYTVHASTGEVFQAYCDMVTDDGYWILIERWTVSPTKTVTWAQVAVRDTPLNTFSNSPASFPVIPNNVLNFATEVLFKSAQATWVNMYGAWLKFSAIQDPGFIITSTGLPAKRAKDGAMVNIHGESAGWGSNTPMTATFAIWTQWGAGGPCGGAGVCAGKVCPVIRANYSYTCHFDFSTLKQLFVRSHVPA